MIDINRIRKKQAHIIVRGAHTAIIQSMLDFDYMSGKKEPSVVAIISKGKTHARFFFGEREILIPIFPTFPDVPQRITDQANYLLNLSSGRRVISSTKFAIQHMPQLEGISIFAENVPEGHALELIEISKQEKIWITGPASVGVVVPGSLKLGAIGGINHVQLETAHLAERGAIAVLSASGGMTNELINIVAKNEMGLSFSLSFGGERYPITDPEAAFLAAEKDPQTKAIVYFGELGGDDEYRLAQLAQEGRITKPVIAYIAGSVANLFETPPQFGHAKAMAASEDESAIAKRRALKKAGLKAPDTFKSFLREIQKLSNRRGFTIDDDKAQTINPHRTVASFSSSITHVNEEGDLSIAGQTLMDYSKNSYGHMVASMLLGHEPRSKELSDLMELSMVLLADHGPQVSGAVNTIISARAGKDLVSSLASGLLTIGPRFGGAVNSSAETWLKGVAEGIPPKELVEQYAKEGNHILGIGHKKYRVDHPDPRVDVLVRSQKSIGRHLAYAREVEAITTSKQGNLILNVDGAIAAVFLDVLQEKEKLNDKELKQLIEIEFFNALFVLARSVGFTAHFLDQKRIDEGLFRLSDSQISLVQRSELD